MVYRRKRVRHQERRIRRLSNDPFDLREPGYSLNVNLYKAEQYGIPSDTAYRVIIVGIREDLPYEFHVPDSAQYVGCDITSKTALDKFPDDASNSEKRHLAGKSGPPAVTDQARRKVWQAEERLGRSSQKISGYTQKQKISQGSTENWIQRNRRIQL